MTGYKTDDLKTKVTNESGQQQITGNSSFAIVRKLAHAGNAHLGILRKRIKTLPCAKKPCFAEMQH